MKRLTIIFVLFLSGIGFAQESQITAVASVGRTENSQIGQKAARTPYFLIFDKRGKLLEVISNPFSDASRRAGPQVAALLAQKNVAVVVAGAFGPKMKGALDANHIKTHVASGVAQKAIQELLE